MYKIDELYCWLDNIYIALDDSYPLENKKEVLHQIKDRFDSNEKILNNVCSINENRYGLYGRTPLLNLSLADTNTNLMAYAEVIANIIRVNEIDFPTLRAINILYSSNYQFDRQSVVYNNSKGQLTIGDLLSAFDYLIRYIEINYDVNLEQYSLALEVFKEINEILDNKKRPKPRNKALHYANKVLKEIYEDTKDDKELKNISLLLDLAIDFFVSD